MLSKQSARAIGEALRDARREPVQGATPGAWQYENADTPKLRRAALRDCAEAKLIETEIVGGRVRWRLTLLGEAVQHNGIAIDEALFAATWACESAQDQPADKPAAAAGDPVKPAVEDSAAVHAPASDPPKLVPESPAKVLNTRTRKTPAERDRECAKFLKAETAAGRKPGPRAVMKKFGCGSKTVYSIPSFKSYWAEIKKGRKPKAVTLTKGMEIAATKNADDALARLIHQQQRDDREDTVRSRERL